MNNIEIVIAPREKDLGGFHVRRILPYATHRMVGAYTFFDHMGPTVLQPNVGMDVRPHPHIGLATVTYLFDGVIRHRDSLGSDQLIKPGDINWMTAGKGIVHSERSPDDFRVTGGPFHGIQVWVALPIEHEETDPTFIHYPSSTLPEFEIENVKIKLLIGSALDHHSSVKTFSDLFYLDLKMPAGSQFEMPAYGEAAAYVVEGHATVDDQEVPVYSMAVIKKCQQISIKAVEQSRLMIIGGSPVGERLMYWNLVASSKEKLENAKRNWVNGPGNQQFGKIPGDDQEFIPLPAEPGNPKGTIL